MTENKSNVKAACLQLSPPPNADKEHRIEHAISRIEHLPQVDLAVLPELWPVGYFRFHRYEEEAESLRGRTVAAIKEVAASRKMFVLGGSFVERSEEGGLHNTSFLVSPEGDLLLAYRKMHVFGYQSKEAVLLSPGGSASVAETELGVLSTTTCYDLRFPELYRMLSSIGAQIVLIPSAWPKARLDHWLVLNRARAIENQVFVVACNMAGTDEGTHLGGHSMIVDPWGEVLAQAGEEEQTLFADLDMDRLRGLRAEFPVLGDRRIGVSRASREPDHEAAGATRAEGG